ncbi:MAG: SDR family oxidoreductase [Clostridia bacterium]|nr:SDR family oxidoreductase [Clostridia bacterium]
MKTLDMFKLDGKVAVVTGGYGLYGKNISLALCEAGASIIIASRNVQKCEEYAQELNEQGYKAEGMKLDLGDQNSIQSLLDGIVKKHGKVDILVNNAVTRGGDDLEKMTKEDWERVQDINATGLFLINQIFVKQMVKQGFGNILNISSIQGVAGPHFPVYKGTDMSSPVDYTYHKWGMLGLTKWMANYYGKYNIRVNAISPGGYYTNQNPVFVERYNERTPLGRMANDDDIKGAVVFLVSDASQYITGENIMLDGGWSCW